MHINIRLLYRVGAINLSLNDLCSQKSDHAKATVLSSKCRHYFCDMYHFMTTTQQTYGLLIDIHTWYIHLLWVLLDTHWWQNVCCMEFNAVTRDHKYAHSTLTIQVCSKKSRVTLCRGSITVLTLCPLPLPSSLNESAPQHAHFSL